MTVIAVKPVFDGLVDRWGPSLDSAWNAFGMRFTINVKWQELQPNAFGNINWSAPIHDTSGIKIGTFPTVQSMLDWATTNNRPFAIRVFCGKYAPPSVLARHTSITAGSDTFPAWWQIGPEYHHLHAQLAAVLDSNPLLREVQITMCSAGAYGESMIRAFQRNPGAFIAAGYTRPLDEAAMLNSMAIHGDCWRQTRSSFAVVPLQTLNLVTQAVAVDATSGPTWVTNVRNVLGVRGSVRHNGWNWPTQTATGYSEMYSAMNLKNPSNQQTNVSGAISDLDPLLTDLVARGCNSVELPRDYETGAWSVTSAEATAFHAQLIANPSWR